MKKLLPLSFLILWFLSEASANVIYTELSHNPSIPIDAGSTSGGNVSIDFDSDGSTDLTISLNTTYTLLSGPSPGSITTMIVNYSTVGATITGAILSQSSSALPTSYQIGSAGSFSTTANASLININTNIGTSTVITNTGLWTAVSSTVGYIGIQFQKSGNTHYGWVKFVNDGTHMYIGGWAYEDVANQNISTADLTVSSVSSRNTLSAEAYPNPCAGVLQIEHSEENISYVLTNANGLTVGQQTSLSENIIDLNKLQNGIYFLELISGEKRKHIKIVKAD